jgi:type I restriction enzyme M protein
MKSPSKVARAIGRIEGFEVRFVCRDGSDPDDWRVDDYDYQRAARHTWRVTEWRQNRFKVLYPDFEVEVLDGAGSPVHGRTLISTVRASYEQVVEAPAKVREAVSKALSAAPPPSKAAPKPMSAPAPAAALIPPRAKATPLAGRLTISELESRLWAAANSLRGPVDPADFKAYVFPLLFFKWVSDTWDLEHGQALDDYDDLLDDEVEADYHRFSVPDGCHWWDLQKISVNVGVALLKILDRLAEANPETLAGIFGDVAWGNKERLPEASLLNLIDAFDRLTLNRDVVPHDMLGAAYEYLLKQFADESGKKAGEFFTPRAVVRLLIRILDPQPGESVYDPACGSGGMLVETINTVRDRGGDTRTLRLYGQEVNLTTAAIARMNLFLHDLEDFRIVRGDTFRDPRFLERSGLRQFDVVVANPPFSLKNWGSETWANDPYGRAFCGVPPAGTADLAWVQHMVASMKPQSGRVGVVMPTGVLFRAAEREIRQCLIERDQLEAVIGLPPNLFYSTTIAACLLIFRSTKPEPRRQTIVFVDGSDRFQKGTNQNQLRQTDIDAIVAAYLGSTPPSGSMPWVAVSHGEIKDNNWDLHLGRYLKSAATDQATVADALESLVSARKALHDAERELDLRLREAGYD